MSSTPEKYYHCTLWKIDIIKFPLFPSKIGWILNSQLLYLTTSEVSEKQKLQKLLNCQAHVCAKHCKNWQIFDWNIQKNNKMWTFLLGHSVDAQQNPTLARPAEPLAACVQGAHALKPTQFDCHVNCPWGIEKLISGWSSASIVLPTQKIWRRSAN